MTLSDSERAAGTAEAKELPPRVDAIPMAIAWGSVPEAPIYGVDENCRAVADEDRPASVLEARWSTRTTRHRPGCHSVATLEGFYALETTWRELSQDAAAGTAFQSWDFAVEWLNRFVIGRSGGATGRFKVIVASESRAGVIGLAPFFEEHSLGQSTFGTTLQPFGRSHSMETLTDEPITLLRRGSERLATGMLTAHITKDANDKGWDIVVVCGARSNRLPGRVSLSLSKSFDNVKVRRRVDLPMVLSLPASWEGFKARVSKSMRDNIAYYPHRLTREIGVWKIQTARSPGEVAVATEHLLDLHRRRSQSQAGRSHRNHIPGETEASFLRGCFQRLARRNQVSIVTLEIAGETVAAQAFIEAGRCISVYYSGYDERWRRYSPLTVIIAEMIRGGIARGFERVEFPPGESAWKSRWGAVSSETLEETSVYTVGLSALFRGLARRLSQLRAAPAAALREAA